MLSRTQNLYNTPMEVGIRLLILLDEFDKPLSSDDLRYLDHLSLHTYDINGVPSLHASVPNRGLQVYAKKELISKAITFLISKQLTLLELTTDGFKYKASKITHVFLQYFESDYIKKYREKVLSIKDDFCTLDTTELSDFVEKLVEKQNKGKYRI